MQDLSASRDCAFSAFITNLGKYNEGYLIGEWVKFPVTNEELQAVFQRIGINRRYEEWFITDYECPDSSIYDLCRDGNGQLDVYSRRCPFCRFGVYHLSRYDGRKIPMGVAALGID